MKNGKPAIGIVRGYARDKKDAARLKAAGVKTLYIQDEGEVLGESFKMRRGEGLGVVDGLRVFGATRIPIAKAVKLVHSWGATIIDAETQKNSRDDGVEMMNDALAPPKQSPEYMAALQEASVDSRIKGRMPKKQAHKIWHGNPTLSNAEVLDLMPGWTEGTAYNHFDKRNVPAGRPTK